MEFECNVFDSRVNFNPLTVIVFRIFDREQIKPENKVILSKDQI